MIYVKMLLAYISFVRVSHETRANEEEIHEKRSGEAIAMCTALRFHPDSLYRGDYRKNKYSECSSKG